MTFHDQTPLRRVEEMRADFVANASHELRTPLATLTGFIETLQGPARDDAAARERFLGIMKQQADRMARLIDDLLSLSRIELNAHRRPDTPVDLVAVVRQVADGLQTLARDRDVEISIDGAGRAAGRARRPRRAGAGVGESCGKRVEIRRRGQAGRHRVSRARLRTVDPPRPWSACATTGPASRPSTCRA